MRPSTFESSPLLSALNRYGSLLLAGAVLSCAAKLAPQAINIQVAEGYRGAIHVSTCAPSAGSRLTDAAGNVLVSDCPLANRDVELVATRGENIYRIPASELKVSRTGDGIVVSIDAHLPE
jgi:hypothetical protein